jgi:NADPH2:quinone reductase
MKAIRVHQTGGPEELRFEDVPAPEPGPGQARIRIQVSGVNFIDVYHRTGLYKLALPFTPGMEGSGVVDAVGDGVTNVTVGDRVAYAMNLGSYAEYALVNAWQLVKLPAGVDFQQAGAAMLQGMTAHYLAFSTFPLRSGETALVHAAAGGVGLLLLQMGKIIGATLIGTVSTPEKGELAKAAGADHVILYEQTDFEAEVTRITGGRGVDVVYDSVGRNTFDRSLRCLRPRGMLALFGQSSGLVPPFDPSLLASRGSVYLTRPVLGNYAASQEEIAWRAGDVLRWISEGRLKIRIDRTVPLEDAAQAHRVLEARQTAGKVLLLT